MKKFKVFVDINEEEKYLNDMAEKGHILKKYSAFGRYHFTDESPKELHYKIDYRYFNKKSDFEDYIALFEDAGWEHVYGTKSSGNQYFLPKNSNADADIFSDVESKSGRYLRLLKGLYSCLACFAIYIVIILISINFNLSELGFLTPGLWEKEGTRFWNAFFFELPFVIFRTVPVICLLVLIIVYTLWAIKAKKLYKEALNKKNNL